MEGIDDTAITKPGPGGTRQPVGNFFRVVRPKASANTAGLAVRAIYEVPAGERGPDGRQLTVGDLQIGGAPITRGGQLAEKITMQLFARACREGAFDTPALPCRSKCCRSQGVLRISSVDDACADVFPASQELLDSPVTLATARSATGQPFSRRGGMP